MIEIYGNKKNTLLLIILGIVMVIASVFVLNIGLISLSSDLNPIVIVGIAGILFFGFSCIYYIYAMFSNKPIIIIDDEGFIENTSALSIKDKIYWEDINDINMTYIYQQKMISINLKDREKFLNNVFGLKRLFIKANIALGFGEINLVTNQLKDIKPNELLKMMEKYQKSHMSE